MFGACVVIAVLMLMFLYVICIQIIVFFLSSLILIFYSIPILEKYGRIGIVRTNADRLIGEKGLVTERIDVINGTGQVKIFGQIWSARSADNQDIEAGEMVEIKSITGVKLIVERVGNDLDLKEE